MRSGTVVELIGTSIFAVGLLAVPFIAENPDHRVDRKVIERIHSPQDWYDWTPEIIYLAQRGSDDEVRRLGRLVPMAVRDDCTCMAGGPSDAAAVVLERLLAIDPHLSLLESMSDVDRREVFRYCQAISPLDWSDIETELRTRYPAIDG